MLSPAKPLISALVKFAAHFALSIVAGTATSLAASPAKDTDPAVTKLVTGLKAPAAIAVQPDPSSHSELFVGESGTGRVIRFSPDHPDASVEAITGFPQRATSKPQAGAPGITSLFFVDHARLLVAGGGDQSPFLKLYEVSDSGGTVGFDDQKQNLEDAADSNNDRDAGSIQVFHSIARTHANDRVADMLLLAGGSDKSKSGLCKIPLRANTLGDIATFPIAGDDGEIHSVYAVAVANTGYVTLAAALTQNGEDRLVLYFLDPIDGRVRLKVPMDLQTVYGLAYNPVTGDLFAAGQESELRSGVYRLDDAGEPGKPRCKAKKIAALPRPTALAFASEATLYVTALETPDSSEANGSVFKVTGF
jgi:hypothetical protein